MQIYIYYIIYNIYVKLSCTIGRNIFTVYMHITIIIWYILHSIHIIKYIINMKLLNLLLIN